MWRPGHQLGGLGWFRVEPCVVQRWGNDHRGTLLVSRLVELIHNRVLIGIDREHEEADHQLTGGQIGPAGPRAGNAERITRLKFNLPRTALREIEHDYFQIVCRFDMWTQRQHQPEFRSTL